MLDALPDSARVWLVALDGDAPAALLADVRAFCDAWTSHGRPVAAAADALAGGRVVAVAALISEADVNAGVSGCGIDAMQRAVETAAQAHDLAVAPALSVTYRGADGWKTASRPAFRRLVRSGEVGAETRVLDLTPTALGALRAAGGAERAAGEAWHATAFQMRAASASEASASAADSSEAPA